MMLYVFTNNKLPVRAPDSDLLFVWLDQLHARLALADGTIIYVLSPPGRHQFLRPLIPLSNLSTRYFENE